MKNALSILGAIFLAMMVLSGCGGSGGTCGNTPACGGDIVGTWTITSSCVSANSSMSTTCPGETVDATNIKISGTVTYNADLTYAANTVLSGSETVKLPLSCVNKNGVMMTCAQLSQIFMGATPNQSATCTGSDTCTCAISLSNETSMATGTYTTTAAGVLTDTPMGAAAASPSDYCVKGKTLTISPHAGSGMMGQSVSGTVTLTKS